MESIIDCTRTLIRQVVGSVKNDVLIAWNLVKRKAELKTSLSSPQIRSLVLKLIHYNQSTSEKTSITSIIEK